MKHDVFTNGKKEDVTSILLDDNNTTKVDLPATPDETPNQNSAVWFEATLTASLAKTQHSVNIMGK